MFVTQKNSTPKLCVDLIAETGDKWQAEQENIPHPFKTTNP